MEEHSAATSSMSVGSDVLLAQQTIETLKTIDVAQHLLESKFESHSDNWTAAMFRALLLKNNGYLLKEKMYRSPIRVLDQLDEELTNARIAFGEPEKNAAKLDELKLADLNRSSSSLIEVFLKLTNILCEDKNRNMNLRPKVEALKKIQKNISAYLESDARPAKPKSSSTSSESSIKVDNNVFKIPETPLKVSKPVQKIHLLDFEGKCDECGNVFTIFNGDLDLSRSLHEQENIHKNAFKSTPQQILSQVDNQQNADALDSGMKEFVIKTYREKLGEDKPFICIQSMKKAYCKLCEYPITGLQNIKSHTDGKCHIDKRSDALSKAQKNPRSLSVGDKSRNSSMNEATSSNPKVMKELQEMYKPFVTILSAIEAHCKICDCPIFGLNNIKTHTSGKGHVSKIKAHEVKMSKSTTKGNRPRTSSQSSEAGNCISRKKIAVKKLEL